MFIVGMLSSPAEWIVVLIIVLIFFGVGKLPKVMGQMGKGVKAFKEGMQESDREKAQKAIDVTPDPSGEVHEVEDVVEEAAEG